jgi:hypothetical protein
MERFTSRSVGLADRASAQAAGRSRLQAIFRDVDVIGSNTGLGPLEVVRAKPGSGLLTVPATDRAGAMRAFLSEFADAYGVSQEEVSGLKLVAEDKDPAGDVTSVGFEQRINGLPVFSGRIRGGFTPRGELTWTTGQRRR